MASPVKTSGLLMHLGLLEDMKSTPEIPGYVPIILYKEKIITDGDTGITGGSHSGEGRIAAKPRNNVMAAPLHVIFCGSQVTAIQTEVGL